MGRIMKNTSLGFSGAHLQCHRWCTVYSLPHDLSPPIQYICEKLYNIGTTCHMRICYE